MTLAFPSARDQSPALAAELGFGLLIDPRTLVIVGRASTTIPTNADVAFPGIAQAAGKWRAASFTAAGSDEPRPLIALLIADNVLRAQAKGLVLDDGDAALSLPDVGRIAVEGGELVDALADAGIDIADAFDFLRRAAAIAADGERAPALWNLLYALLASLSRQDGVIEIAGTHPDGTIILQGWSTHLPPGPVDVGIVADSFVVSGAGVATFLRTELPPSARGFVMRLATRDVAPANLTRVHYRVGDRYFHLDPIEQRTLLAPEAIQPHLATMLARLTSDDDTMRGLRRLSQPRFAGQDTISALNIPVRLGIDLALHADGAGFFLSGWLLDPRRRAVELVMRNGSGETIGRLNGDWARLARPDVTKGFAGDALFAGDLARSYSHHHGFMTFLPHAGAVASDDAVHVEIALDDGGYAFLPLRLDRPEHETVLPRLLGSINTDDPSIDEIISRHIGPLTAALGATRRAPEEAQSVTPFGIARRTPRVSAIIPVGAGLADLDVNFAQLAGDRDFDAVELIVVAPRSGGEAPAATAKRVGGFYGLGGSVVLTEHALDPFEALEIGTRLATGDTLLMLSPNVLPRRHGWLSELQAALAAAPEGGVVSPTLLYEDESIRFAGSAEPPDEDAVATLGRFTGYSGHWLRQTATTAVWACTMECALMPRRLLQECGGFSRSLLGPEYKNADFALSLLTQRRRSYWAPHVTLYAADDGGSEPPAYWTRVRSLVDRWAFRRQWSRTLSA